MRSAGSSVVGGTDGERSAGVLLQRGVVSGIRSNSSDSIGANAQIGVEAALHDTAVQDVVERQQAHALVVRHVGVDHYAALALALGRAGEIDRFVEAHRAHQAEFFELLQIRHGGSGLDREAPAWSNRARPPVLRLPGPVSAPVAERRRPDIDRSGWRRGRCRRIRKCPREPSSGSVFDLPPTASRQASSSSELAKVRVNSSGIRYSNMVPLQESNVCPPAKARAGGQAKTSAPRARRLWRWRPGSRGGDSLASRS